MEHITVIYDNKAIEGFQPDWGFSALIELNDTTILFDTGAKEDILKFNMQKADISPSNIDTVFISHNHWDHTGGLNYIIRENPEVELFMPEEDCYTYESSLPEKTICVPITAPTYITERVISTGVLPTGLKSPTYEQSLIVSSNLGFILITGCSHPGIVEIAKRASFVCGENLFLILGGFHLYEADEATVHNVAKELVRFTDYIAPCHCTGDRANEVFRNIWGDRFIPVAAGVEIPLEEV